MKLLVKVGILGLLAGGTATAVYGDPAGGWLSPNGTNAGPAPATSTTVTGGVTVSGGVAAPGTGTATGSAGVTGTITLTLSELTARVVQLHEQIRADARHIQHLQLMARKEKDVIKLNCVNDKLVQVKPQMNLADVAEIELESAADSERGPLFEGIQQAAESIRRLREEADQCIGEPVGTGGESSNSFSGPGAIDDPTKGFEGEDSVEPPGYASPFN